MKRGCPRRQGEFDAGAAECVGCPRVIPGDFDRDGDVDRDDSIDFETCASGPGILRSSSPTCDSADFDTDDDADQADFAVFQRCYSGEDQTGDPNCAD